MKKFPLLHSEPFKQKHRDCRKFIPWELFEGRADWARRNHGQTLETLASRGGLAPTEALAIYRGVSMIRVQDVQEFEALQELDTLSKLITDKSDHLATEITIAVCDRFSDSLLKTPTQWEIKGIILAKLDEENI